MPLETTCAGCGVEAAHYWDLDLYPISAPRAEQQRLCRSCRKQRSAADFAANAVPCVLCGELVDPRGGVNRVRAGADGPDLPVHYLACLQPYLRKAPKQRIVDERWRERTWNVRELWVILECRHWYRAKSKGAKSMGCRWCALAALAEKARKEV
jgi:hypothetical protein